MTVGLVLAGPPGDGSWNDRAVAGAERVRAAGWEIEVRTEPPDRLPERWRGALAHGVQLLPWLTRLRAAGEHRPLVLTDLPAPAAIPPEVTTVDWGWAEGTRLAGALAAAHAAGRPIGILAGPAVPTQQRVVAGFLAGAYQQDPEQQVYALHLASFADPHAEAAAAQMVTGFGCAVMAHAADAAGERGCAAARARGAATIGFLGPLDEHLATVTSDLDGVVARLLTALASGERLPAVVRCTVSGGEVGLRRRD